MAYRSFKGISAAARLSSANTSLMQQTTDVTLDEVIFPSSIQLEIDVESTEEIPVVADLELAAAEAGSADSTTTRGF